MALRNGRLYIINIIKVDSDAQALVLKFEVSSLKGKNLDSYNRYIVRRRNTHWGEGWGNADCLELKAELPVKR